MAKLAKYYHFDVEIWSEDGESFTYHVNQEFTEDGRDRELLVYGDDASEEDATQAVLFAIKEVME